jgi:hypothetical protein
MSEYLILPLLSPLLERRAIQAARGRGIHAIGPHNISLGLGDASYFIAAGCERRHRYLTAERVGKERHRRESGFTNRCSWRPIC